jgi:sec-independent protein translocase protein TatC
MTVVEHLAELRRRIIISLVAVALTAVIAYIFAPDIISWLLDYYKDATDGEKTFFVFTGPLDAFVTRLKIATYGGILLAVPIWLWQLWRFITPGLNPNEKRYAVPFVLSSVLLFAAGGFVALKTLPQALNFLLDVGGQDLQPLLTADKYISLVSLMILAFGLAFEFPVLLVFLLIARVLNTRQLGRWRRWAAVLIVAFAAVITPSQDPYSLFFMAIPMYLFYEGSIVIGKVLRR